MLIFLSVSIRDPGRPNGEHRSRRNSESIEGRARRVRGELAKLDKAITVLEGLFRTSATTPNGDAGKRTLSAAARRKIGKAQKLRWAKLK